MLKALRTAPLIALLAFASALEARAQYVATTTANVPYPTLTNASPIVLIAAAGTPNDRGRATIPIGFNFPYYNQTDSQVTVTANGMAFLEPSSAANQTADFFGNVALPNVAEPNGVLAVVWDDLNGRNPNSAIRSQALSSVYGPGLAIEWSDWNYFVTSMYSLTFQIRLWQNGIIEYYYGPMTGNGGAMSATVGIESPDGTQATTALGCSPSCAITDFSSNSRISFGPPTGWDLSVTSLQINSVTSSGPDLIFDTTVAIKNFGTVSSAPFTYRLYLSPSTVIDPSAIELTPTPQGPLTVPAYSSASHHAVTSVTAPATGAWYLLAMVNGDNLGAETNPNNNLGATVAPLSAGVDLYAQSIDGPALGGPGDTIVNHVVFSNLGFNPAGNVPVKIYLSVDSVLDGSDTLVYSGSIPVVGGQTIDTTVSYVLPNNIPSAGYYFILQLDDGPAPGQIVEISDLNNVVVSNQIFTAEQADLVLEYVNVLQPTSPYGAAPYAFFGENIRLEAKVSNQGGATANGVYVLFFLSDNNTLSALNDPFIGQAGPFSLAAQQSNVLTLTAPVPTTNLLGLTLLPGPYFFFAAAQAGSLVELSTQNNEAYAPPLRVENPAPDLLPTQVVGPSQVGAGEDAVVVRSLANVGNRPAGPAKYRYYLSANPIITETDLLLPMVEADGGLVNERSVTLETGAVDTQTETVHVPLDVAPATYYLGVLIDPPGATGYGDVQEVDENNNGLAGQPVKVIGPALSLMRPQLPDGIVGLGYQGQLAGQGGDGSYTFALASGSQLPAGLSLSTDGVLSGTPTAAGAYGFGVQLSSAGQSVQAQVAMRVVPLTGSLGITTLTLPSPARGVAYSYQLGAQGGRAPYAWSVATGGLPAGIALDPGGTFSGTCTSIPGTEFDFTLEVLDAAGNRDRRDYAVVVVDPSALVLTATGAPAGKVGQQYLFDVSAANANGAPPFVPFTWEIAAGALPPGIVMQPSTSERVLLSGTPVVAGVFSFTIEVTDVRGRTQSADVVLRIDAAGATITGDVPDQARRGDAISVQLSTTPALDGVTYDLRDGLLPPGLTLSPSGLLSGTIAADATYGRDTFTVQVGGAAGAAALRSFTLEVVDKLPTTKKGCGCDGAGGPFALALVGLLGLLRRPAR